MSSVSTSHGCTCRATESNLEAQVQHLARRQEMLANLLAAYMKDAGAERGTRAANARVMADAIQRIVGGVETNPDEFKDCCVVGRENANWTISWFCTGVLVHRSVVITAAHCAPGTPNVVALNAQQVSDLSNASIIRTRPVVRHPMYPSSDPLNDIAVLILRLPAAVAPTPMASREEISAAQQTTLVGFGNNDLPGSTGFGVKRKVTVDFTGLRRDPATNLDDLEHRFGFESDLEFVAGGGGFDSCNGDSGGPAYIAVAGGQVRVAGVTSRATADSTTRCGGGGIYSRVDVHHAFIKEVAHGFGIEL